jgi:hypothetical protein
MDMGEPLHEDENGRGKILSGSFERVLMDKIRKVVEKALIDCIDNMDLDDFIGETVSEIVVEVLSDKKVKEKIRTRVFTVVDDDMFINKMSDRVMAKLLK